MHIIRSALESWDATLPRVTVQVDRLTLAKRRWRGTADDGTELGFDLVAPLPDGATVFANATTVYGIVQQAEAVLEIALIPRPAPVARLGWAIGNLHFPIQVTDDAIRVPDDPALRQLFERQKISYTAREEVFTPFARAHRHDAV